MVPTARLSDACAQLRAGDLKERMGRLLALRSDHIDNPETLGHPDLATLLTALVECRLARGELAEAMVLATLGGRAQPATQPYGCGAHAADLWRLFDGDRTLLRLCTGGPFGTAENGPHLSPHPRGGDGLAVPLHDPAAQAGAADGRDQPEHLDRADGAGPLRGVQQVATAPLQPATPDPARDRRALGVEQLVQVPQRDVVRGGDHRRRQLRVTEVLLDEVS